MLLTPQEREFENEVRQQKLKLLLDILQNPDELLRMVGEHDVAIDELERRIETLEVLNGKGN